MRIRAFLGAAMLCLASLAFAPAAMADPVPDIPVVNFSEFVTIDHASQTPEMSCMIVGLVEAASIAPTAAGRHDVGTVDGRSALVHAAFSMTNQRQHEDPGRISSI